MRTDNPATSASAVHRLRDQVDRARRTVSSQRPALRWSLLLAVVAGVAAFAYLAIPTNTSYTPLRQGLPFSGGDVVKITGELEAKSIRYRVDEGRRILVASDSVSEAQQLLTKLGIGPHSLEEIRRQEEQASSFLDLPGDKLRRQNKLSENELAEMIRHLEGVVSAYVRINRPKPGLGSHTAVPGTAFVWLETEGDRPLRSKTAQQIQDIVVGHEPDIRHTAVTVFDQKGRHYLDANDPKVGLTTRTRAREEELKERILEKLEHIKGVGVTVQVIPAPAPPAPPPVPTPAPAPVVEEIKTPVVVNQPVELEPEPKPAPPAPTPAPVPPPVAVKPAVEADKVRVLVTVPMSHYLRGVPGHRPSKEELKYYAEKTEHLIRTAVEHVVPVAPGGEPPRVTVNTIPDDSLADAPPLPQGPPEPRRALPWWAPAGSAAALASVLTVVGYRVLASARRTLAPAPSASDRGRFKTESASEPGPSERVRELIRLNPEAAASVLHRWTGQGGTVG